MAQFRKKPVVIEAFRLGIDSMPDWFCDARSRNEVVTGNTDDRYSGGPDQAVIKTLEGNMVANFGDWVIRGVKGEIYPCKPEIFAVTYEPAGEPSKLWLWKNFVDGRPEYWAFDNPYPTKDYPGGDPMTLGSPCGYALVKSSFNGRPEVTEQQVVAEILHSRPA